MSEPVTHRLPEIDDDKNRRSPMKAPEIADAGIRRSAMTNGLKASTGAAPRIVNNARAA